MHSTRLAALAAGIALALTGSAAAHATATSPVQVKIYLENNNHNPGTVTADCKPTGPMLHTALFNDAIGANVIETAKIYREDTGAVVFGPVDVPIGGHVAVDMPYLNGVTFNAVAVPKGDPWPATVADLLARLSAKPPTADNSQLFPSGYPAMPADCPIPVPPNPCGQHSGNDLAAIKCPPCPEPDVKADVVAVPTCVPSSEPSSKPSTKPSTSASTSASSTASPAPTTPTASLSSGATATSAVPSPTGTATATSTTGLAHTGATWVPFAIGALLLLAAGLGFLAWSRRAATGRH